MKMKKIVLAVVAAAALSLSLSGCGETEVEMLNDRVTQGQRAGDAVDLSNDKSQEQSDQVDEYLDYSP